MALRRVFVKPDESLAVVRPAPQARKVVLFSEDGGPIFESDSTFYARTFADVVVIDPSLDGLPYIDLDDSELPPSREHRDYWRLRDGRVVVELPDSSERG